MTGEQGEIIDPNTFRKHALNFEPLVREQTAHATEVYLQLKGKGESAPTLHDYLTTLANDTSTPIHDVSSLGDLLLRYPQLPVDMIVDLGSGVMAALPLGRAHERQLEKLRIAKEAGIDMDTQGQAMVDKVKAVLAKLEEADNQEGIETRLFTLQAQRDEKSTQPEEDDKNYELLWERIIPNYVSGIELKRIAEKRITNATRNN